VLGNSGHGLSELAKFRGLPCRSNIDARSSRPVERIPLREPFPPAAMSCGDRTREVERIAAADLDPVTGGCGEVEPSLEVSYGHPTAW
jgi:hypothetical protein